MKIYSFSIILLILGLIAKTSAVPIGPFKHSDRISSPVPSEENDNDDLLLEMSPTVEPKVENESALPSPSSTPLRRENNEEEAVLFTETVLLDVSIILDSFKAKFCGPQRKALESAKKDAEEYVILYGRAAACLKEVRKNVSMSKRAVRQLRQSLERVRRRIKELEASIKAAIAGGNIKLERRLRMEMRKVRKKMGETKKALNEKEADHDFQVVLEREKSGKEISLKQTLEKVTDILVVQRSKYLSCKKKYVG